MNRYYNGLLTRIYKFSVTRVFSLHKVRENSFKVFFGSFRQNADYDDAWMLALGLNHSKIIDIGCNMGQSSLLFSYGGPKNMILIDPQSIALSIAFKNLIDNDLADDVIFVCAFISDSDYETIDFWSTSGGAAGSKFITHSKSASKEKYHTKVRTLTVDAISTKYMNAPELIKIDVEGAENDVLRGAESIAKKGVTKFFVEMHANPELSMRDNAEGVLLWCRSNGYSAWYMKEHRVLTSAEDISHRGKCHLLLLPSDSEYPEYLKNIPQGASVNSLQI